MRRILVKSLNEAFDFVMDHYYPVVLVSPLQKINFVKAFLLYILMMW